MYKLVAVFATLKINKNNQETAKYHNIIKIIIIHKMDTTFTSIYPSKLNEK